MSQPDWGEIRVEVCEVSFFACIDDAMNKNTALAVYEGKVVHTDIFSRVFAVNRVNLVDYIVLHVRDNLSDEKVASAVMLGIMNRTFEPCVLPTLVCKEIQAEDERLMKHISVGKETQAYLKKETVSVCFKGEISDF